MEPVQTRKSLSQLRRGTVEYCVLSELDGLVTSEGTIYPLLTRQRKEQLVTTFWRESESGPPRRYYELTDAGQSALEDFAKEWARFRDSVDAILTKEEG